MQCGVGRRGEYTNCKVVVANEQRKGREWAELSNCGGSLGIGRGHGGGREREEHGLDKMGEGECKGRSG
jgi:hypothetical protein